MSFKRIKRKSKTTDEKQRQRRFAIGWAIQTKLNSLNYEFIFIDELSVSNLSFKFYDWSKKGKSEFIRTISDSFSMSFLVAFSADRFYGIMGIEEIRTSQIFIYFLYNLLKEIKKVNLNENRPLAIVLQLKFFFLEMLCFVFFLLGTRICCLSSLSLDRAYLYLHFM